MLRIFSQAMNMDLPVPTSRRRLSNLRHMRAIAPRYMPCGHTYDRIVHSVNGFDSISETRMQLQPAREPRMRFPEQYMEVLLFSSFTTFPIWKLDHETTRLIESERYQLVDKLHREAQCSPYCYPISIFPRFCHFVAGAERGAMVHIPLACN